MESRSPSPGDAGVIDRECRRLASGVVLDLGRSRVPTEGDMDLSIAIGMLERNLEAFMGECRALMSVGDVGEPMATFALTVTPGDTIYHLKMFIFLRKLLESIPAANALVLVLPPYIARIRLREAETSDEEILDRFFRVAALSGLDRLADRLYIVPVLPPYPGLEYVKLPIDAITLVYSLDSLKDILSKSSEVLARIAGRGPGGGRLGVMDLNTVYWALALATILYWRDSNLAELVGTSKIVYLDMLLYYTALVMLARRACGCDSLEGLREFLYEKRITPVATRVHAPNLIASGREAPALKLYARDDRGVLLTSRALQELKGELYSVYASSIGEGLDNRGILGRLCTAPRSSGGEVRREARAIACMLYYDSRDLEDLIGYVSSSLGLEGPRASISEAIEGRGLGGLIKAIEFLEGFFDEVARIDVSSGESILETTSSRGFYPVVRLVDDVEGLKSLYYILDPRAFGLIAYYTLCMGKATGREPLKWLESVKMSSHKLYEIVEELRKLKLLRGGPRYYPERAAILLDLVGVVVNTASKLGDRIECSRELLEGVLREYRARAREFREKLRES